MRLSHLVVGLALVVCSSLVAAPSQALAKGPDSVAGLAAELSPAVVNIGTSRKVPMGMPFPQVPEGSPLEEMFDDLNPNHGEGEERMQEATSLGSGFIISADGVIVTNNHVIEGADEILVYLTDGTRLPAKLLGADQKTDLAVLKIEAGKDLPFVAFGDSDSAVVGDWVMAIGNPFGLGGSVTLGIVSARNRDIQSGPYDQFIQTDAAINQGNSGGPLFNMDGEVVGINTAIIARGGQSLGIGFAVPVNLARTVIDQLREFGETRRGWLGVGIQEVSEDIALSLGIGKPSGALVIDVTAGGPSAGVVEEGDIILSFDGKTIEKMRDLPRVVADTAVGKAVTVKLLRSGEEKELAITLGRLEDGEKLIAGLTNTAPVEPLSEADEDAIPSDSSATVGFEVAPVDEAKRAEYGLPPEAGGIIVTDVDIGSDADSKGLMPGLLINEVNQRLVMTVDEFNALVAEAREAGRPAVLFKVTDAAGSTRFIAVRLG